jgi:hypothetical protein
MCNFKSAIVLQDLKEKGGYRLLMSPWTESHSELEQIFKLHEGASLKLAKVEYSPEELRTAHKLDTYKFRIDENRTPEWFDEEMQASVILRMNTYIKSIIIEGDAGLLVGGEFIVSPGASIQCRFATVVAALDNSTVKAWDNSTVEAWGNSTVEAWGNSTVEAWDNSTVEAWGNSTVEAWGNSTVKAWGNSTVKALDNSTVEAWGNSTVKALGNSTVEALGNSTVEALGNSTVKAWGNSTVKAWDNSTVEALDNSTVEAKSKTAKVTDDRVKRK